MRNLFSIIILLFSVHLANAQSYYLMPATFFPEKGGQTQIDVYYGKGFDTTKARKTPVSQLAAAFLYNGKKPMNLLPDNKDNKSFLPLSVNDHGLYLIAVKKTSHLLNIEREELQDEFSDEGFGELASKLEDKDEFNIDEIFTAKTLVMAEKPSGNYYSEKSADELEIVLEQNPYKMQYGEDLTAQVLLHGKPVSKVKAEVYTRGLNGTIFISEFTSDEDGKLYIKLNRTGEWMIKVVQILPSKDKDNAKVPDFRRWSATYSFGFKS